MSCKDSGKRLSLGGSELCREGGLKSGLEGESDKFGGEFEE